MRKSGLFGDVESMIITVLVIVLILAIINASNIVNYVKIILPNFGGGGGVVDGGGSSQMRDKCERSIGFIKSDEIYFSGEKISLYLSGSDIYVNDGSVFSRDPTIGNLGKDNEITIFPEFLDATGRYSEYKDSLPNIDVLIILDKAFKLGLNNEICVDESVVTGTMETQKIESQTLSLLFTEADNDEVFVKWVYGKGPAIKLRANQETKFDVWIFIKDHPIFEDPSIKEGFYGADLRTAKGLLNSDSPAKLAVNVWSLSARGDVLLQGKEDVDPVSEVYKLFYGSVNAPEDKVYSDKLKAQSQTA